MARASVVLGRDSSCEVCLEHPTVSARHARIYRSKRGLVIEDLSSANGTFVAGRRIVQQSIKAGDDVTLGQVRLPWSHEALRPLVRASAGRTLPIQAVQGRQRQPGRNAHRPSGSRGARRGFWIAAALVAGVGLWFLVVAPSMGVTGGAKKLRQKARAAADSSAQAIADLSGLSPEEAAVRVRTAPAVARAIDSTHPTTRNAAVKLAAKSKGPFHVDQVVRVWQHAHKHWRYVNDPKGQEYFAAASESIDNGYAGDCDDFATLVSAMIEAIGGETRVVMMQSDKGGHAYAETRVKGSLKSLQTALDRFSRRILKKRVRSVHARAAKPIEGQPSFWLNLDWNAHVPGGPYEAERWAVAIYPDGRTEQLSPATSEGSK